MNFDKTKFYLGKLCKRKHQWQNTGKSLRKTKKRICNECVLLLSRRWTKNYPNKKKEHNKKWRLKNLEYDKSRKKIHYIENKKQTCKRQAIHYKKQIDNLEDQYIKHLIMSNKIFPSLSRKDITREMIQIKQIILKIKRQQKHLEKRIQDDIISRPIQQINTS
jgi:hypothetical protein